MPVRPEIEGISLDGVFELHTMEDSFRVKTHLERNGAASAIIIGAGYIGVEMADALSHLGMKVTLVGRAHQVFPSVDPELGSLIEHKLKARQVDVVNGTEVVNRVGRLGIACDGEGRLRKGRRCGTCRGGSQARFRPGA